MLAALFRSWGWGPPKPPDSPKPKTSRLERWLSVPIPAVWDPSREVMVKP